MYLKEEPEIDSIFIYNDQMAIGVLRALFGLGIKVPDDVAVVGHDDIETAKYYTPAHSTIKVPSMFVVISCQRVVRSRSQVLVSNP